MASGDCLFGEGIENLKPIKKKEKLKETTFDLSYCTGISRRCRNVNQRVVKINDIICAIGMNHHLPIINSQANSFAKPRKQNKSRRR